MVRDLLFVFTTTVKTYAATGLYEVRVNKK